MTAKEELRTWLESQIELDEIPASMLAPLKAGRYVSAASKIKHLGTLKKLKKLGKAAVRAKA